MFNKGKDSINGEIRKILKKFVTEHSETQMFEKIHKRN